MQNPRLIAYLKKVRPDMTEYEVAHRVTHMAIIRDTVNSESPSYRFATL